jgi:putative addiction module component (TIGR02574 family)
MPTTIDIRDLPARLDEALALAATGQEVILLDGPTPRARLIPFADSGERIAGLHAGAINAAADFDAPLPEIWETLAPLDELEIPESHREELDRRLALADANPAAGRLWEEVRARLRGR